MKKIMMVLAVILLCQFAKAQEIETLSGHGKGPKKLSAYGVLRGTISTVDKRFAVITGGYGGVFLNKKIMLGAGGYNLTNSLRVDNYTDDRRYSFWYCGAVAEYVHNSDKLFHWSAGTLIGGGGISERIGFDKGRDEVFNTSGVVVAEPFINAEMNITPYIRIVAGGTYRQVFGVGDRAGITDGNLSGPGFHLGIKAGVF